MDAPSKTKRKQLFIAVGGVAGGIALLVLGMWLSDPNRGKPTPMEIHAQKQRESMTDFTARSSSSVSAEEVWRTNSEKVLEELRRDNAALRERLNEIDEALLKDQSASKPSRNLPANATPVSKPQESGKELTSSNPFTGAPARRLPPPPTQRGMEYSGVQPTNTQQQLQQPIGIQMINLSNKPVDEEDDKPQKNISHYLPAGSFATAVLLAGVDAPTGGQAKSQPVPTLLRLMDAGQLPNYWNSDVASCHVTGAAHGDIASERVHIRLEILSCVLTNGDVVEESIKGYVAGEDGKAGLRGRLVSKQGSLIAKSLLAGVVSGVGNSITQQYQQVSTSALGNVTTVDPNKVLDAGVSTGTANALEKVADFYLERANEIYPILEVDANRIGEIVLLGGTDFGTDLIGNTRDYDE